MSTTTEYQALMATLNTISSRLAQLVVLDRDAAHNDSFTGGPSVAAPRTEGTIANPLLLPWLTIENRSAVPLGLTPGSLQSDQAAPMVPAFSVPPLYRATVPVSPSTGVIWSLHAPGPAGWTAAKRSVPYIFHASGAPLLEPLYPTITDQVSVLAGAIAPSSAVIVQAPSSARPSNPDAVIVAVLVAIDAAGTGAVSDLVSLEPCYDYAADGVTAAGPWASVYPFAGLSGTTQLGAAATLQLAGATGVQVSNRNAGGGQTITPIVTLFYGTPA